MDAREAYFLLLQINDTAFPIGSYAHSYGLETYIQKGKITNAKEAEVYIRQRLRHAFLYNELLSARLAWEYAAAEDMGELNTLEELFAAANIPQETREAAVRLGSRFVKTVCQMACTGISDVFQKYAEMRRGKPMVHAVAYGVFCAAAGIPCSDAAGTYLYAQTSAMVTNCVKTIPLSQTAGQQILFGCHAVFREILQKLDGLTEEDLFRAAPGFDIRSMQHEGLYSRLYMS